MLSYSDFILSKKPYSYCRLNEPVGYNVYSDISGNRNHAYYGNLTGTLYKSADNRTGTSFAGDADISSITPLSTSTSIDWTISTANPKVTIPTFYADHPNYYTGRHFELIAITELWGEVIMGTSIPSNVRGNGTYYETFAGIGPLRIYSESICTMVGNPAVPTLQSKNLHIGIGYQFGYIVYGTTWGHRREFIDVYSMPTSGLRAGDARFTLGVKYLSTQLVTIKIAMNGVIIFNDNVQLNNEHDYFDNTGSCYGTLAVCSRNRFSNMSIFYNQPFPSQNFLTSSQTALDRNWSGAINGSLSTIASQNPESQVLDTVQGSTYALLDTTLLNGTGHYFVESIDVTEDINVVATLKAVDGRSFHAHGLKVGDIILIQGLTETNLDGCWTVDAKTEETVSFVVSEPVTTQTFNETVILKLCPVGGGGGWIRETQAGTTGTVSYRSLLCQNPKKLIIDDINKSYSIIKITSFFKYLTGAGVPDNALGIDGNVYLRSNQYYTKAGGVWTLQGTFGSALPDDEFGQLNDKYLRNTTGDYYQYLYVMPPVDKNQWVKLGNFFTDFVPVVSNPLYIKKNLKSSNNLSPTWIRWAVTGDDMRFFMFVAYRQNSPSHAQTVVFGEIQDFEDEKWYTTLVAYKDSSVGNVGFNYAFSYPNWSILPTGHLLCQENTQPNSDARWVRSLEGSDEYLWGYGDTAHHIYPVPKPHVTYTQ